MPAVTATAPGKIILFGEHAVVYGRPAIAVPVSQVRARAVISANPRAPAGKVHIQAPDVNLDSALDQLPPTHPFGLTIINVLDELGLESAPACTVRVTSTIPLAAGLGSGAAISVAMMRAFSAFLGRPLPEERISELVFEVEKIYHGTPSGIDNTVVTYNLPVYFVRGQPVELLRIKQPFVFVIGDSGIKSPTAVTVGDVRQRWKANPTQYETLFDEIGNIAKDAKVAIEAGRPIELGALMDKNHDLLRRIDVSSPELDSLVVAARTAGALGAKLSGGGRGGNMIALAAPETSQSVADALKGYGASRVIITCVETKK